MFDALLSYSSVDRPFAVRLRAALETAGKTVWLDKRDIQPAEALLLQFSKTAAARPSHKLDP